MKLPFILLAIGFVCAAAVASNPGQQLRTGKDFAIFFAIDDYANWPDLRFPVEECTKLANELRENYSFEVSVFANKSRTEIIHIIADYQRKTYADDSQLLVYFSGHGYFDGLCSGYFVPREGSRNDENGVSYINFYDLQQRIARIPCKHILLLMDACYAGTADITQTCPDLFPTRKGGSMPGPPGAREEYIRKTLRMQSRIYYAATASTNSNDHSEFATFFLDVLQHEYDQDYLLKLDKLRDRLNFARHKPYFGEFSGNQNRDGFVFVRNLPIGADHDRDGVPNADDRCPDEFGTPANGGCPSAQTSVADYDLDGIPNDLDGCPNNFGTAKAKGCPDGDDDGVPDMVDRCPDVAGEASLEGCPAHKDAAKPVAGVNLNGALLNRISSSKEPVKSVSPDTEVKMSVGKGGTQETGIPVIKPVKLDLPEIDIEVKMILTKGDSSTIATPAPDPANPVSPDISFNKMILVKGGAYDMGDPFNEGDLDEKPAHRVTVSDFYLGKFEVTFEEYDTYCLAQGLPRPSDNGWGRGQQPIINISWLDAVAYCNWRSVQEKFTPCYTIDGSSVTCDWSANGYRLPTEAEWEYAARQGAENVRFSNGKNTADPAEINFDARAKFQRPFSFSGTYRGKTMPVGSFSANSLGFYDMSGNVSEWCWDWRATDYYQSAAAASANPHGPASGTGRVLRGGSWRDSPQIVRATYRNDAQPVGRSSNHGFRLARTAGN